MARKKNFADTLMNEAPSLAIGGISARAVNKYLTPSIVGMLPPNMENLAGIVSGIIPLAVGSVMLSQKEPMMQNVGRGMIATGTADVLSEQLGIFEDAELEMLVDEALNDDSILDDSILEDDFEEDDFEEDDFEEDDFEEDDFEN